MDWAGRTEDRGNAGETAGSFFHPSGPSEFGYLIQRKGLILQPKLAPGADRTPFHPVNPGRNVIPGRCRSNPCRSAIGAKPRRLNLAPSAAVCHSGEVDPGTFGIMDLLAHHDTPSDMFSFMARKHQWSHT